MDLKSVGKRITYKRCRPNPVFEDWLKGLYDEAKEKKSKLEPVIQEALNSLVKYPLPLQNGADCAILKGFDRRICLFLDKRLDWVKNNSNCLDTATASSDNSDTENPASFETCKTQSETLQNGPSIPSTSCSSNESDTCLKIQTNTGIDATNSQNSNTDILPQNTSNSRAKDKENHLDTNLLVKGKPKRKKYAPKHGSGGFAILLTLLEHSRCNPQQPSLTKEEIIEKGQKHSNESFTQVKPESFYSAWSNMSRLLQKGLVSKTRTKKILTYSLTDEGMSLAAELLHQANNTTTVNDIIFDKVSITTNEECVSQQEIQNIDSKSCSNNILYEMEAGSFEIILLIDKNETGGVSKKNDPTVAQFNKYPDQKHEYRNLKVGDFTWIARSKTNHDRELVLPYIIERKRMDDLGASIKDGRFHEQKFRLRKCGLPNVIYMIENYGSNKHVGLPLQSLKQALANTRVQDHFKIHVTESLSNSARFLAMMTKRLTIEYKDRNLTGSNCEPQSNQLMTFVYFNKSSSKTRQLTVTETFIKMLLQLKGVSVEKALAVTNCYQTPKMLIKAYEACDKKEGEMLLANLRHESLNRNVGPSVSKAIYQLLSHYIK